MSQSSYLISGLHKRLTWDIFHCRTKHVYMVDIRQVGRDMDLRDHFPSGTLLHLTDVKQGSPETFYSCSFCPLFLHFDCILVSFSLLPPSSLESHGWSKPPSLLLSSLFYSLTLLSLFLFCLLVPLCLYLSILSPFVLPFLFPLPVPEGREKEVSQSHQCDLF